MSEEHVVSLIRSLIWAGSLVICVLTIAPVISHAIRKDLAIREQELRAKEKTDARRRAS